MGYYFISFHAPCKGFYDLVVFVITNDLSDNALKAADENSGDEPGGGAQSNKALRDEVRRGLKGATKERSNKINQRLHPSFKLSFI
jgi:hypothetical protein